MSVRPGPPQLGIVGRVLVGAFLVAGAIVAVPSGFGLLWFVPFAGVGAVLVIRRPRTSIGWLLLVIGSALVVTTVPIDVTIEQFRGGTLSWTQVVAAEMQYVSPGLSLYSFAVLAIVFPSGRLPAGRWGAVARLALGAGSLLVGLSLLMPVIEVSLVGLRDSVPVPNPWALLPDLAIWTILTASTAVAAILVLLAASLVSLVVRHRRAEGVERQQLRWLTAALGFVIAAIVGGLVVGTLVPEAAASGLVWVGAIVAFPCVPIAIGIAVLRYRLYEIDRIISRTIGWASVTGLLVAVFAGGVLVLQTVLTGFTQGQTLAVAASTLVAFALFQPVRRRVQSAVDRRFDRAVYDAEATTAALAERLRDEIDLATLGSALLATADDAMHPVTAALWLRPSRGIDP